MHNWASLPTSKGITTDHHLRTEEKDPHASKEGQAFGRFQNYNRPQGNYRPPQYNSTNAPRSINNIPAPMDTSARVCAPNRGRGNYPQGRLANARGSNFQTQWCPDPNNRCYKCGSNKHWARNCPQTQGNLINFMSKEPTYQEPTEGPSNGNSYMTPVEIKAAIEAMSSNEKGELAHSMDTREDFPTAWSG
jgi:Zinc knuckle